MNNLKSFAQHIREGLSRFDDDYRDLNDDDDDFQNDFHPFVDEEEETEEPALEIELDDEFGGEENFDDDGADEFDDNVFADEFDDDDDDTQVGNIHQSGNEHQYANLLDAHGAAIETGDMVDDLHHGGSYVVAELSPFKVVSTENGRVFGAEFDSDRFKVTDKGHSIDSEHYRTTALHNHAHEMDCDHELCQKTLGFKPTSYEHIFHSKELHDHIMSK